MKDRKRPEGTKARVQASKKRLAYIGTAITVTILVAIIAVSSFVVYSFLNPSSNQDINLNQNDNLTYQFKAAIVDHLSLSAPNQTFIQSATNILEKAGYIVDYYPSKEVTVEFYRNLPTHGYGLIVLRVHSALAYSEEGQDIGFIDLFSSELYSTNKYVYEQWTDQVSKCMFLDGGPEYFGISPPFVKKSMNGRFINTTIIMMGCDGLTYTSMAEAFIEKGAKVYISWNRGVVASHTDRATIRLLKNLLTEKQTVKQAVTETMKDVGPDPTFNAILLAYPEESWEDTIPSK